MSVADTYLRYLRFGRDAAESSTKTYAGYGGFLAFAMNHGDAPKGVLGHLFEFANNQDLPVEARGRSLDAAGEGQASGSCYQATANQLAMTQSSRC